MPKKTGTVIFFDLFKSWGFIHPDDGSPDVFVHADGIESEDHPVLQAGDHVSFWITEAKEGAESPSRQAPARRGRGGSHRGKLA